MIGNIVKKAAPMVLALVVLTGVKAYAATNPSYFYDGSWHEYAEGPVYLRVNGQTVTSDMPPILYNDSTLVPARAVFEKMGAKITWDEANSKVIVNFDKDTIVLNINSTTALVNGQNKTMPIPAKIINDRTMIPVRFVSESLGNRVSWDDSSRLVDVEAPVNIKSITSNIVDNKLRINITSDKPFYEINSFVLENNDRVVLDMKDAVVSPQSQNITIPQNSYVTGVRAAQTTVSPYLARVVADLGSKTDYSVNMSEDKKSINLDINLGNSIGTPQVSYGVDSMDVKLPVGSQTQYYLYSIGEKGIFYLDIPKSSFKTLPDAVVPSGSGLIKKIEFSRDNDNSRLKVYSDKPVIAKVINENGYLTLRLLSQTAGKIEYTNNNGIPRVTLKSEITGFNYFRYSYRYDGSTFILKSYSNLGSISGSKLFINDGIINTVVFQPSGNGMEYYFEPTAGSTKFRVNSVSTLNAMYVEPYTPRTVQGQNVQVTDAMKQKLVVIDPGHGGSEPGAAVKDSSGNNVYEKDLNLDISLKLYSLMKNAGFNVILTRNDDSYVDLYERARIANDNKASLFVSVHNNITEGSSGTMSLYYPSLPQSNYGISSERVAQLAQEEILGQLKSVDLGIYKRPRLAVLNGINMPGVLAEVGVMNNPQELANLQNPDYRAKAAAALFTAIKRALYEEEFKDYPNETVPSPAVSRTGVDTSKAVSANGFSIPALSSAKCAYNWKDSSNGYYFDLTIMLDYSRQLNKTATLDEQRKEAIAVLNSKLDATTVSKITDAINRMGDYSSHIYEEEIENSQYTIWVRSIKTTGICSIDIRKK